MATRAAVLLLGVLSLFVAVDRARAAEAPVPPKIKLEKIAKGMNSPLFLTNDGSADRMFIIERPGLIRIFQNGAVVKEPFLDISERIVVDGECGMLGLAFHPKFAQNGLFYVHYDVRRDRRAFRTVIAEFRADPKSGHVDPATERVVLSVDQPSYSNHKGGMIAFGPDGFLYIGLGDGGSANDPSFNGQNTNVLLAKMLRVDVDQKTADRAYGIPKDNPFADGKQGRPEIFAWGLRNPWRFSFDRGTGKLWCGDVGQNLWEEIDIVELGKNYGWNSREGTHFFSKQKNGQEPTDLVPPIKEYPHEWGKSVTGGYVYRGKESPSLVGWYLYIDYATGKMGGLKLDDKGALAVDAELGKFNGSWASFGEDATGEIYLCDMNGSVYRIGVEK